MILIQKNSKVKLSKNFIHLLIIGENQNLQNGMRDQSQITAYDHPEFSKNISQELLKELQTSQTLDDGFYIIHNAIEYVKSNRVYIYVKIRAYFNS